MIYKVYATAYNTRYKKMVEVLEKRKAKFRVIILDLEKKSSRTISLLSGKTTNIDILKEAIQKCLAQMSNK